MIKFRILSLLFVFSPFGMFAQSDTVVYQTLTLDPGAYLSDTFPGPEEPLFDIAAEIDSTTIGIDSIYDWMSELRSTLDSDIIIKRSLVSFFVRPQTLLHRHPMAVGGIEIRPTKRLALVGEYGYGLDYSLWNPKRYQNLVHSRWRVAINVYGKQLGRLGKENYKGIEFWYFPLQYFAEELPARRKIDGDKTFYDIKNAAVTSDSWGVGFTNGGRVTKNRRFYTQIESSYGVKFRNNRVTNISDLDPFKKNTNSGGGLFVRNFKFGNRVVFYTHLRVNFSFKLFSKKTVMKGTSIQTPRPDRTPDSPVRI